MKSALRIAGPLKRKQYLYCLQILMVLNLGVRACMFVNRTHNTEENLVRGNITQQE